MRYPLLALLLFPAALPAADVTATKTDTEVVFKAGGELVTIYTYAGTVAVEKGAGTKPLAKPYFFPLNAPGGVGVTRPWPMIRGTAGETVDHFHQKSVWFCHGDVIPEGIELKTKAADKGVKGIDFWSEFAGHGRIVCTRVSEPTHANGAATIVTTNDWQTADGVSILTETRTITVRDSALGRLIALETALTPTVAAVTFGDTKEGSLGVRIPDDFRLLKPDGGGVVTAADGTTVVTPAKDNLPVWGKLSPWNDYSGIVDRTPVGLAIFTAPANPYPCAWHTRAYGLMAANPFARGGSGFPALKGKTDLVKLKSGEKLTLKFALYAHTGDAAKGKVAEAYQEFAGK